MPFNHQVGAARETGYRMQKINAVHKNQPLKILALHWLLFLIPVHLTQNRNAVAVADKKESSP